MDKNIVYKTGLILDGCAEQDVPMRCPECFARLSMKHIIGTGEYPKGGYRNIMKPNRNKAVFYECPECFTKSAVHSHGWGDIETLEMKLADMGIVDFDEQKEIMRDLEVT